MISYSLKE